MSDSILISVKKNLGLGEDYTHFDADIIMHINTVLGILAQLGVGPTEGYAIENDSGRWVELIGDEKILNAAKTYVYLKVRMMFDPPTISAVIESMNRMISELEWRLTVAAQKYGET